jgi:ribosomal protein L16 Arg81 hydroxylase
MSRHFSLSGPPLDILSALVAPAGTAGFLAEYWQRRHLLVRRDTPDYFDELLKLDDIDALLADIAIPASNVNLGQNAVGLPPAAYQTGGFVSAGEVLRHHRAGNTIILRAMHLWLPRLRALCEAMQEVFLCEAQANIYLTPANTQSSYPHWDAHDIFVIQVAGRKRWILHENALKLPLYTYEFDQQRHPIGDPIDEFELAAGDLAYVPRGVAHNPKAEDYSVHIALGVKVKTWADVLAVVYERLVTADPSYREALPIAFGDGAYDRNVCARQFPEIAGAFADARRLEEALSVLHEAFAAGRRPSTRGILTGMPALRD